MSCDVKKPTHIHGWYVGPYRLKGCREFQIPDELLSSQDWRFGINNYRQSR